MNSLLSQVELDEAAALVVERLIDHLQAGEVDVESFIAAHPEHAPTLRQLLPALRVLSDLSQPSAKLRATTPDDTILRGDLGDNRLVRQIGQGGMGVVFEAEQRSLARHVAVKILPFASLWPESALKRFANEVRIAASLEHSHIVPIYGVGCESGVHFYIMKLIAGCSLLDVIRCRESLAAGLQTSAEVNSQLDAGTTDSIEPLQTRPISQTTPKAGMRTSAPSTSPSQPPTADTARIDAILAEVVGNDSWYRAAARLAQQAAEALAFAHQRGVVHRDIKPSNLLLDCQGKLFVADFGLARCDTDINLTRTGELLGTPRYMSPEQASGRLRVVDARTDIYALGATLYELITLQPVVRGPSRAAALRELQDMQVVPPREHDAKIPLPLQRIVLKCLQSDPKDRYRTAQELADDLRRFLDGRAVLASSPGLLRRLSRYIHGHPRSALGVVAVLTLCLLIPGFFWFADRGYPSLTTRGPQDESVLGDSTATAQHMLRPSKTKNASSQDSSTSQRGLLMEQLDDGRLLAGDRTISDFNTNEVGSLNVFVTGDVSKLENSADLVFGPDRTGDLVDDLYVLGRGSNNIVVYDGNTGAYVEEFAGPTSGLRGAAWLAFGTDGDLYTSTITETGLRDSILRFNLATKSVTTFVSNDPQLNGGLSGAKGMQSGPDGNLYVASVTTDQILRYDGATGVFMDAFVGPGSGLDGPGAVLFGPDRDSDSVDDLYVSSNLTDEILVYSGVDGSPLGAFVSAGSGGLDEPHDMEFGPDENLYVVSSPTVEQVYRFDGSTGAFMDIVIPQGRGLQGATAFIAFDGQGELYVSSERANEVLRFAVGPLVSVPGD